MSRIDERTFRFTATEVHDLLNAAVCAAHPDLPAVDTEMSVMCTAEGGPDGDGEFQGAEICLDEVAL